MTSVGPSNSDLTEVTGYVESSSNGEVVGWAWKQGAQDRLRIELRSGKDTISSTTADGHRVDLKLNGVGDGCHAFRLTVPSELRGLIAESIVVALDHRGVETLLTQPPSPTRLDTDYVDFKRNVELLVGSQRVIHRNLQAALLKQGPSLNESIAQILSTQTRLVETIETLELFTVRIEDLLQSDIQAATPSKSPLSIRSFAALALIACLLSSLALWRVLVLT